MGKNNDIIIDKLTLKKNRIKGSNFQEVTTALNLVENFMRLLCFLMLLRT